MAYKNGGESGEKPYEIRLVQALRADYGKDGGKTRKGNKKPGGRDTAPDIKA